MKALKVFISRWVSKKYFPEFLLVAICLLTYANCLNNNFLIDDHDLILNNFKAHYPKYFLFEFFPGLNPYQSHQSFNYYRPLANVFPMLLFAVFKLNVFGHHFVNVVIFYFSSLCIFKLIRTFFNNETLALLTSVLFIIHPFNGFIVCYISAGVFGIQIISMILSILLFQRSLKNREPPYKDIICSALAFILALLCHDNALMLPVLIAATQFILYRSTFKKSLLFLIPHFIIASAFFVIKMSYSYSMPNLMGSEVWSPINLVTHLASVTRLMAWYLEQLFVPKGVVFIWSTPGDIKFQLLWALLGTIVVISCGLAVFSKRMAKELRWSLSWFLIGCIAVAVASRFEPSSDWLIEPHWIYLPSIACFFLINYIILYFAKNFKKSTIWSVYVLYLMFILVCSLQLNRIWSDEKRYCQYWTKKSPDLTAPLSYLASVYLREGDLAKAKEIIEQAINKNKKSAILYYKLASIYLHENQLISAEIYFRKALEFSPQSSLLRYNLALIGLRNKQIDTAQKYLDEAIHIDPMLLEARLILAKIFLAKGNIQEVLDLLEVNLNIDPNHPQTIELIKDLESKRLGYY